MFLDAMKAIALSRERAGGRYSFGNCSFWEFNWVTEQ